jgi:hypothetical protein
VLAPREDQQAAQLRSACEMVAGNCTGGVRMLRDRFPIAPAGAAVIADQYCPPGDEPVLRLHRLVQQTTHINVGMLDCAYYVEPARAARRSARNDEDKLQVATVMTTLARCFSEHRACGEAHALAAEANALAPRLDAEAELSADCPR